MTLDTPTALYRLEAVHARALPIEGKIELRPPSIALTTSSLALLTIIVIFSILLLGKYVSRVRVSGSLVPQGGILMVRAPSDGRISNVYVSELSTISPGSRLVQLTSASASSSTLSGDTPSNVVNALLEQRRKTVSDQLITEAETLQNEVSHLRHQLSILRSEQEVATRQAQARTTEVLIAREIVKSYESLAGSGYVSQLQILERKSSLAKIESDLVSSELDLTSRNRAVSELELKILDTESSFRRFSSGLEERLLTIEEELLMNSFSGSNVLTADRGGLVSALHITDGQMVRAGDELLSIVPEGGSLEAHFLIPERAATSIEVGQSVLMRFDAYPFELYGSYIGSVTRLSKSAIHNTNSKENTNLEDHESESTYRLVVSLPKQSIKTRHGESSLLPGMTVEADIPLEEQTLLTWLLSPISKNLARSDSIRQVTEGRGVP